jgi:hypothetical protein
MQNVRNTEMLRLCSKNLETTKALHHVAANVFSRRVKDLQLI